MVGCGGWGVVRCGVVGVVMMVWCGNSSVKD